MKKLSLSALVTAVVGAVTPTHAAEPGVGDPAPDFSLQASDGRTYTLTEFRGKEAVVLAWYPKVFTPGCTAECKSLAQHGDELKKFKARYLMVSVDTVEQAKAFGETHGADFPLLADPTRKTATAYGVLNPLGFASRWTFYIGLDGKIAAIDKDVHPATTAEDMVARLTELKVPVK